MREKAWGLGAKSLILLSLSYYSYNMPMFPIMHFWHGQVWPWIYSRIAARVL